jgi:hypothetical protein
VRPWLEHDFVGFRTAATSTSSPYDWWLEPIAPDAIEPANLWEAMCIRRFGPIDPGTGGAGGSAAGGHGAGGNGVGGSGGSNAGAPGSTEDDGGCGCRIAGKRGREGALGPGFAALLLAALGLRRARATPRPSVGCREGRTVA